MTDNIPITSFGLKIFQQLNTDFNRMDIDFGKTQVQKTQKFDDKSPLMGDKLRKWYQSIKIRIFISFFLLAFILGIGFGCFLEFFNQNSQHQNTLIQNNKTNDEINSDLYDFIVLNTTTALCLDGSPGAYYISKNGNPDKIYLHFQSGGWCGSTTYQGTLQNCYKRSKTQLGSSKFKLSTDQLTTYGIFSQNQKNYFKDWKKVFLLYCDGTGHQGTRKDPIQYQDTFLYFRGHNLTTEKLDHLEQKIGLFSKSKNIVVSGESAGGAASLMWVNYIAQRAKDAKVYGFAASGIFYDSMNFQTNRYDFREGYINLMNITNKQIDNPLTQCVKKFTDEKYKCMFVQYFYPFLKVPVFLLQSLYDAFSIPAIIGIRCSSDYNFQPIYNCTEDKQNIVRSYRKNVTNLLEQIGKDKNNGIWAIDCVGHNYLITPKIYSERFEVPQNSGNTISKAFQNWIQNKTNQNVFIDQVQWPNNEPCCLDNY